MLNLDPTTIISRIIILLISFTVHECAHAWMANYFGDDTAKLYGRLSLNPLVHLDLMGALMLLVAGFGWAKPVPINPYTLRRKSPSALMWVSLAGPLSNFILAALAALPLRFNLYPIELLPQWASSLFITFIYQFIIINLALMLFNLIPISPLDGEKIAEYLLPESWSRPLQKIQQHGMIILLVILFALPLVGIDLVNWILTPIMRLLFRGLTGL